MTPDPTTLADRVEDDGPTIDQEGNRIMTIGDAADMLTRIKEIDDLFEGATGWGSWMVQCANEREDLVNSLAANGVHVEHRFQARTSDGGRTD